MPCQPKFSIWPSVPVATNAIFLLLTPIAAGSGLRSPLVGFIAASGYPDDPLVTQQSAEKKAGTPALMGFSLSY
ncbi:hypothetical protein N7468_006304 [Penicillium chermesinum]|uniref:Uncharacterized protein n=1 Tax=Penicillium chermesinum TaxID=63820 RepID=A0A9W9TJQ5_9EURO|nr:uncharacterized protein N7468_006304 [Penicillium chermesinum]KAJ5225079.1 hypothetical protein N7468_006304 [Penicillium chermesinum]